MTVVGGVYITSRKVKVTEKRHFWKYAQTEKTCGSFLLDLKSDEIIAVRSRGFKLWLLNVGENHKNSIFNNSGCRTWYAWYRYMPLFMRIRRR